MWVVSQRAGDRRLVVLGHSALRVPPPLHLAHVLGLNLDEAAKVMLVDGAVGVMGLGAGQALARDAAGKLLLQADNAHSVVALETGGVHLKLGWDTGQPRRKRIQFYAKANLGACR